MEFKKDWGDLMTARLCSHIAGGNWGTDVSLGTLVRSRPPGRQAEL